MHKMTRSNILALLVFSSFICLWHSIVAHDGFHSCQPMSLKRSDMTAVTIGDLIYVVGGCVQDQDAFTSGGCTLLTGALEIYSPAKDTWKNGTDSPLVRYRHTSAVAPDSKMVVIGGRDDKDIVITSVDVYDTIKDTWTSGPALPVEHQTSDGYSWVFGSVVYYAGGYYQDYSSSANVISWDMKTSPNGPWKVNATAPMLTSRGDFGATVIDDKVYVFGGFNEDDFCNPLNETESYNPSTNQWSIVADMNVGRGDMAEADSQSRLFVIGGERKDKGCVHSAPIRDVEMYDVKSNTWTVKPSLPDSRMRFAGTAYKDYIFTFGGQREDENDKHQVISDVSSMHVHVEANSASLLTGSSLMMTVITLATVIISFLL